MKADGLKLKELLESEGYSPKDVYEKRKLMTRSNLYYYFAQKKLKKNIVEPLLNGLNIPLNKFYTSEQMPETVASDPAPLYNISFHQGKNLQTYLDSNGVSVTHFAKAMNVSRPTIYNLFAEKELPLGTLLEAAYILNIPVAQLKGRGTGEKSFEKDIYLELKSINEKLASLQKFAKVS